jgi:hypothetical protein
VQHHALLQSSWSPLWHLLSSMSFTGICLTICLPFSNPQPFKRASHSLTSSLVSCTRLQWITMNLTYLQCQHYSNPATEPCGCCVGHHHNDTRKVPGGVEHPAWWVLRKNYHTLVKSCFLFIPCGALEGLGSLCLLLDRSSIKLQRNILPSTHLCTTHLKHTLWLIC